MTQSSRARCDVLPFPVRPQPGPRNWSNDEIAEFCRIAHILQQSGLKVEIDSGVSDIGDPWFIYVEPVSGDVVAHFARIAGFIYAIGLPGGRCFSGPTLHAVTAQIMEAQSMLRTAGTPQRTRLLFLPIVAITAFVAAGLLASGHAHAEGAPSADPGHGGQDSDPHDFGEHDTRGKPVASAMPSNVASGANGEGPKSTAGVGVAGVSAASDGSRQAVKMVAPSGGSVVWSNGYQQALVMAERFAHVSIALTPSALESDIAAILGFASMAANGAGLAAETGFSEHFDALRLGKAQPSAPESAFAMWGSLLPLADSPAMMNMAVASVKTNAAPPTYKMIVGDGHGAAGLAGHMTGGAAAIWFLPAATEPVAAGPATTEPAATEPVAAGLNVAAAASSKTIELAGVLPAAAAEQPPPVSKNADGASQQEAVRLVLQDHFLRITVEDGGQKFLLTLAMVSDAKSTESRLSGSHAALSDSTQASGVKPSDDGLQPATPAVSKDQSEKTPDTDQTLATAPVAQNDENKADGNKIDDSGHAGGGPARAIVTLDGSDAEVDVGAEPTLLYYQGGNVIVKNFTPGLDYIDIPESLTQQGQPVAHSNANHDLILDFGHHATLTLIGVVPSWIHLE